MSRKVETLSTCSISFSQGSLSAKSNLNNRFSTMSKPVKSIIKRWLEQIGVPLGSIDGKKEWGVISDKTARTVAKHTCSV